MPILLVSRDYYVIHQQTRQARLNATGPLTQANQSPFSSRRQRAFILPGKSHEVFY